MKYAFYWYNFSMTTMTTSCAFINECITRLGAIEPAVQILCLITDSNATVKLTVKFIQATSVRDRALVYFNKFF
jgi:hypothetical protein